MPGVITTGNHPKALWPGIHAWFGSSYDEFPEEYPEIFTVTGSQKAYEEDVGVTGFGFAPIKTEGTSASYDSETQDFTKRYTHVAYALGYIVTYEEMQDGQYEIVSKRRSRRLAYSMRQTKEVVAANVLNRGFTAGYTGGDGIVLFSASHPTLSGNQSNIITTAADFSEASLEDLLIQIRTAKGPRGLIISLKPMKLIIPANTQFDAERTLKSTLRVDTPNNDINAVRNMGLLPQGYVINDFLTDTDAWFVKTSCPDGMTMFNREDINFEQDNDFDTKNAKAKSYMRFSVGWTDWRAMFGSAGA
jgi:hypothetical protein